MENLKDLANLIKREKVREEDKADKVNSGCVADPPVDLLRR